MSNAPSAPPAAPPTPRRGRWPWQRSFQARIVFAYGAVFAAVLALFTVWVGRVIYDTQLNAAEHDLEVVAFLAANALEDPLSGYASEFDQYRRWAEQSGKNDEGESEHSGDGEEADGLPLLRSPTPVAPPEIVLPRLQQVAALYANDAQARVTILDTGGHVLADSHHPAAAVANQGQQVEVAAALAGVEEHAVRPDPFTGEPALYAAAPIQQGNQVLGTAQVSRPVQAIMAGINTMLVSLAGAAILALALATGLAIWIGRRLVQPIQSLERAALAAARGDLTHTVPVTSADEIGALAAAFNYMVGEVRSLLEQQRAFVANASHELRTPLANIKLRSEALRSLGNADPALTARYVAEIDGEADRLARLANDLLNLAQIEESGAPQPPRDPVSLDGMLRDAAVVMQLRAEQAGLTFIVDLAADLPPVRVDPDQVEGVVLNLLDNALKYTPAGGRVVLRAAVQGDELQVRVEDSGPGIPPADLPHIFDRFYRVDKVRSRRSRGQNGLGSGAGLGLSIARALVERNGGRIWVEPAPEGGSVFAVAFPVGSRADRLPRTLDDFRNPT